MVFSETQLNTSNALSILESAVYLTQEESIVHPSTIPVCENSRLGVVTVNFGDIVKLAESNGMNLASSILSICETDNIDPHQIAMVMEDSEVILYPEVVNESIPIVVSPISENDEIYQLCLEAVNAYAESGDESHLTSLLEVEWGEGPIQEPIDTLKDRVWGLKHHMTTKNIGGRLKNVVKRNPYKTGYAINLAAPGLGVPLQLYGSAKNIGRIYDHYKNRPRSVIAKKIASLRDLYSKWLHRAKIERDDKTASVMKMIATNIMLLIDKLLLALQKGIDKIAA